MDEKAERQSDENETACSCCSKQISVEPDCEQKRLRACSRKV